jgi:hypothetical protein
LGDRAVICEDPDAGTARRAGPGRDCLPPPDLLVWVGADGVTLGWPEIVRVPHQVAASIRAAFLRASR